MIKVYGCISCSLIIRGENNKREASFLISLLQSCTKHRHKIHRNKPINNTHHAIYWWVGIWPHSLHCILWDMRKFPSNHIRTSNNDRKSIFKKMKPWLYQSHYHHFLSFFPHTYLFRCVCNNTLYEKNECI